MARTRTAAPTSGRRVPGPYSAPKVPTSMKAHAGGQRNFARGRPGNGTVRKDPVGGSSEHAGIVGRPPLLVITLEGMLAVHPRSTRAPPAMAGRHHRGLPPG